MSKILERELLARGGEFEVEKGNWLADLHQRATYSNKQIVKDFNITTPLHIKFHFTKSRGITTNCFTDPDAAEGDRHHIVMNIGLIIEYSMLFGAVMCDSRNFPHVGDPSLDDGQAYAWPRLTDPLDLTGGKIPTSNCPVRAAFAYRLAELVFEFTLHHEQAHILRGHTEYINSAQLWNTEVIEEGAHDFTSEEFDGIVNEDAFLATTATNDKWVCRQALERDADGCAILRSLQIQIGLYKSRVSDSAPSHLPAPMMQSAKIVYGSMADLFYYTIIAIFVFFRVFNHRKWNPYQQVTSNNKAHPHLMFRIANLLEVLESSIAYGDQFQELKELRHRELAMKSIAHADLACHRLLDSRERPYSLDVIELLYTKSYAKYKKILAQSWNANLQDLSQFAKGGGALDPIQISN